MLCIFLDIDVFKITKVIIKNGLRQNIGPIQSDSKKI